MIVCDNARELAPIATALAAFHYPLTWQGLLIPFAPNKSVSDLVQAPMPFMAGIDRDGWCTLLGHLTGVGESVDSDAWVPPTVESADVVAETPPRSYSPREHDVGW